VPFNSTFTTQTGADLQAAAVTNSVPSNGAQNIPVNSVIQLQTDHAVDPTTVNVNSFALFDNTKGGNALPGTYSVSPGGTTITFAPSAPLATSDTFEYYWNTNMRDISGNGVTGGTAQFKASSAVLTTAPTIVATNPPDGSTGVPTNLTVQILFSEPIQAATISGATLSAGGAQLAVTPLMSNGNQTLTLIPPGLLLPATSYTLTISGVVDVAGNTFASTVTQTFTTGPAPLLARPGAVTITPAANATGASKTVAPSVALNAPINPLTLLITNFFVYQQSTGQTVPGTISLSADGLTATYTPAAALAPVTVYVIRMSNVTDLANNSVNIVQTAFTTGP
jgi:hypothetical protein